MIAKRNEFVKKTAGHRVRRRRWRGGRTAGRAAARDSAKKGARGYGNPYFKKGLEKLQALDGAVRNRGDE